MCRSAGRFPDRRGPFACHLPMASPKNGAGAKPGSGERAGAGPLPGRGQRVRRTRQVPWTPVAEAARGDG